MGLVIGVIVVVAVIVIWKFYIPSTPKPEVTPKEKIVASQPDKAANRLFLLRQKLLLKKN